MILRVMVKIFISNYTIPSIQVFFLKGYVDIYIE